MKSVRLIPVVIFAALALLLFKGIGLVTNGGYVLTGTQQVAAEDHAAAAPEGDPSQDGAPVIDLPSPTTSEMTLTDAAPTLDDNAPTLATRPEGSDGHASSTEEGHASSSEASAESSSMPSVEQVIDCPVTEPGHEGVSEAPPPSSSAEPSSPSAEGDHATSSEPKAAGVDCAAVAKLINEYGDAIPTTRDKTGKIVPLDVADGVKSEDALTARLSERRAELDKLQAELDMRTVLVEAAEKRLNDRATELAALEAKVAALVDEKQAAEDEGFKGIVSMYETMKPKEAAKIFDTLSLPILLKVARSMNPRKMSPILAAMSPKPAEALTTAFATTGNTETVAASGENLAALPQIVGQ